MKTTKYTFDISDVETGKVLWKNCKYEMPGKHTGDELVEDIIKWCQSKRINTIMTFITNVKVVL